MRKPDWMRVRISDTAKFNKVNNLLKSSGLNTVCVEANCPNRLDCFSKRTATFMILGRNCTRNCQFCNVVSGIPESIDKEEPLKIAKAVKHLDLRLAVITSVTRDDLEDGGAFHFVNVIKEIRKLNPDILIEVLIPDFKGNINALKKIVDVKPDIINHNVETIPRLYSQVRPQAIYKRSLELLKNVKEMDSSIITKSGIMLGLGENKEEVVQVLKDLYEYKCELITIGQYLPPSNQHYPLERYVTPEEFNEFKVIGEGIGLLHVESAPMVRSSYNAYEAIEKIKNK